MFSITTTDLLDSTGHFVTDPKTQQPLATDKAYIDVRGCIGSLDAMEKCLQVYVNASTQDEILIVSLGDEIGVSDSNPNHTSPAKFAEWCEEQGHTGKPGCGGTVDIKLASAKGDAVSNGRYYYSNRFVHDVGIERYKGITDLIKSMLPRALVGANYSPTGYAIGPDTESYCHAYLGIVFQWIELFRKGGMTLPWYARMIALDRFGIAGSGSGSGSVR